MGAALMPALGSFSGPFLWYVTRATGISAYVVLTLVVFLGSLRSIARVSQEQISWVVDELHQFCSVLAGILVLGHMVALLLDPFIPFTLINLILPIHEPYNPPAVTYGIFGLYAMFILLASSWLRRQIPYAIWRSVHYISIPAFILFTLHGMMAGSDAKEQWNVGLYAGASAAVAFMLILRIFIRSPSKAAASDDTR